MDICFITKNGKPYSNEAIDYTKKLVSNIDIYDSSSSDTYPPELLDKEYDLIISYISNWIIPEPLLKKTKRWNINFHPGPPEYPGIGCFNFAIYNSASEYGATAHLMDSKVDTGDIIRVHRFEMSATESVTSLSNKTYKVLFSLLKEVINHIVKYDSLPETNENWLRAPYKRNELEELAKIDLIMSKDEIDKRIRATYYPGKPAPFIEISGHKFEYNPDR